MHERIIDQAVRAALADCDEIRGRSAELAEQLRQLEGVKGELPARQGDLDELMKRDADALADWARKGCPGKQPGPDMRAREAALKAVALAKETSRAADEAIGRISAEQQQLAHEFRPVADRLRAAEQAYLVRLHADIMTRQRDMHDELAALEGVAERLWAEIFALDNRGASDYSRQNEATLTAWRNSRDPGIGAAVEKRLGEIADSLPNGLRTLPRPVSQAA